MWLIDYIKGLFVKKNNYSSIISNSKKYSREEFAKDNYVLEQVDYYKNKFIEILDTSKSIKQHLNGGD